MSCEVADAVKVFDRGDANPFGDLFKRLPEGELLSELKKRDDVATAPKTEAVEDTCSGIDAERRGAFVMVGDRTASLRLAPRAGSEMGVAGGDLVDRRPLTKLPKGLFWDTHATRLVGASSKKSPTSVCLQGPTSLLRRVRARLKSPTQDRIVNRCHNRID